jgi:hypothetical protein
MYPCGSVNALYLINLFREPPAKWWLSPSTYWLSITEKVALSDENRWLGHLGIFRGFATATLSWPFLRIVDIFLRLGLGV